MNHSVSSDPILKLTRDFEDKRHVFVLEDPFMHPLRPQTIVPAGFETDLGSIPRIFWNIVSPAEIGRSAIVHDWLTTGVNGIKHTKTARLEADIFLREAVKIEVGPKTAWVVYLAVRTYAILARKK